MKTIIGRTKEQETLHEILQSGKPELLALYGRRRVGKTYLVTSFFEKASCVFFYTSGLQKGTQTEQLEQFYKQIGVTFYKGASITPQKKWLDAFEDLTKAIELIPSHKKVVLFFDEFPWMATKRSKLLEAFDFYWNRYWSHNSRIKIIICGSSASWIIENIINNKGGLYNRVTRTIQLNPFTLCETKAFLNALGIKLNDNHILDIYMVLGGIPHYLALLKKGRSAHQNISELCFQRDGSLVNEFNRLFASLFKKAEPYLNLIKTIAKHRNGISKTQLIQESKEPSGGRTTHRLKELEEVGFITSFLPVNYQERGTYYKITDEYILFYLSWIKPHLPTIRKQIQTTDYWLAKINSPSWQSWSGYAFEAVCFKHLPQIQKALDIHAGSEIGSWQYIAKTERAQGAQIDLLFDRPDAVITICEIKYSNNPFVIDKSYAKNLLQKIEVYKKQTKTKKHIFLTMITANGLKPSMYSEELVTGAVTLKDLFK